MAEIKSKRLRPEDWSANEDAAVVNLGFESSGRRLITWDMAESKNLLLAGYGVRQTEWELASIIRHAKQHGIDVYGQDFSSYVNNFPKGSFKSLTSERGKAQQMLQELAASEQPHVLIITALNNLLAPIYVPDGEREDEPRRRAEMVAALRAELANPASHVVIVTSRLHEEIALPAELLGDFPTYVLTSKVFARDLKHILREDQPADTISDIVHKMSASNSVLIDTKVEEFENFRTPVR